MNKPHKIGIDARFLSEAGPGRYVKNILEHLEQIDGTNEYTVFLTKKGFSNYYPKNMQFKKYLTDAKWYSVKEQTKFLYQVLKSKLDLFYVPHFNIPILYPGKLVTAIPDIIMHTYSTERGTTLPKPYFKLKKLIYKKVLHLAIQKSYKVIVPTYDVYNDITNYYPLVDKSKFVVAYEGVDPDLLHRVDEDPQPVLREFGLTKDGYLLYVSSMYEHKNVERLLKAFDQLISKYSYEGKLVLIGKNDKFSQRIFEMIKKLQLQDKVILPGMKRYITDKEVMLLRQNAKLYAFPSLKEGFSLTPLEAQAIGLPCAISNISCHKEVFGDSVYYFDPLSVDDIALRINYVLKNPDLQLALATKGLEQVKKYNWLYTAKATLQIFNEALG
jgi:glycosyltransferase involved in cell wall biosynthesis